MNTKSVPEVATDEQMENLEEMLSDGCSNFRPGDIRALIARIELEQKSYEQIEKFGQAACDHVSALLTETEQQQATIERLEKALRYYAGQGGKLARTALAESKGT